MKKHREDCICNKCFLKALDEAINIKGDINENNNNNKKE